MSMLAEKKRKTKWIINPTKKPLWITDSDGIKFGKGLMEKMGWSAGKGLGINEQGMKEPLKVSYKNDTKGMGFKGNDDDWIEHQDEFNSFLNQLQNSDESVILKASDAEKNEVKSLEEKSKWSKARVHYQKFTRGKDLSKYSENDLACILGTNKTKNEKSKIDEEIQDDSKIDNNTETCFGVTTINSGSIQDYFKKKWVIHKKTEDDKGDEVVQNFRDEDNSFQNNDEESFKKKKFKLSFNEGIEMTPQSDGLEEGEKKKKKKKRERELNSEEEIENKRKKNDVDHVNGNMDVNTDLRNKEKKGKNVLVENNDDYDLEKNIFDNNSMKEEIELKDQKKKKKKKDKEDLKSTDQCYIENRVDSEEKAFETELVLKKKKKSKKEKHCGSDDETKVNCDILDSTIQSNVEINQLSLVDKKKKRKKDKKTKEKTESCDDKNSKLDEKNFKDVGESEISLELLSKQKKKKNKTEFVANIKPSLEAVEAVGATPEVESIRKKRKKEDEAESSAEKGKKSTSETESPSEVESKRKKHKKKDKKQREEIESSKNSESDNCFEEKKKFTKDITSEEEPVKKKMKKNKKDKSLEIENNEFIEHKQTTGILKINEKPVEITNEGELSPDVESVKKKKKKKKEKLIEKEELDFGDNNTTETTNTTESTSVKKKKNKKDKIKELLGDCIETENSESCVEKKKSESDETNSQEIKMVKEEKVKNREENNLVETKQSEETNYSCEKPAFSSNKRDNNYSYTRNRANYPLSSIGCTRNNYNSQFLDQQNNILNFLYSYNTLNPVNGIVGNESGVQNHKTEFLNDKKADKFYPGRDRNEKLLRLVQMSDFSEFRGSNLVKLMGYGFLRKKIHNKPL